MQKHHIKMITGLLGLGIVSCASAEMVPSPDAGGSTGAAGNVPATGAAGDDGTAGSSGAAGSTASGAAGSVASGAGGSAVAGAGGTTASGTAGAGASTCAAIPPADLVSDFETGAAAVAMVSGRAGSWFVDNDGTGTQMPIKVANMALPAMAGGACNSAFSFRTSGQGFTTWGAEIGTDLAPHVGSAKAPYDGSVYSGIALRAKAATTQVVRVSLSDGNTATEGMVCVDTTDDTNKKRCGDYFGTDLTLTPTWTDYPMPFAQMKQRGFGLAVPAGLDKAHLYTLRLEVTGSPATPANFDFSIDDVRFTK